VNVEDQHLVAALGGAIEDQQRPTGAERRLGQSDVGGDATSPDQGLADALACAASIAQDKPFKLENNSSRIDVHAWFPEPGGL
jgi:hypothetical protein